MKFEYLKNYSISEIKENYEKIKSSHLEKLATKMLNNNQKIKDLNQKQIKGDFLKNF
jgi:hypothetical protein